MTDRRTFLTSAGLAAVAAGAGLATTGCTAPQQVDAGAAEVTVPTADIPVGGGKILSEAKYVVTQPEAGTFKAFSKTCTHQGCPVTDIQGQDIVCKCHGARFSVADGSVVNGPATRPLTEAKVTVTGDSVTITAN